MNVLTLGHVAWCITWPATCEIDRPMIPDNGGGDGEHEGQEPHQDGDLLGLGRGAQVLGLHWVNHRVVSEGGNMVKSANSYVFSASHYNIGPSWIRESSKPFWCKSLPCRQNRTRKTFEVAKFNQIVQDIFSGIYDIHWMNVEHPHRLRDEKKSLKEWKTTLSC